MFNDAKDILVELEAKREARLEAERLKPKYLKVGGWLRESWLRLLLVLVVVFTVSLIVWMLTVEIKKDNACDRDYGHLLIDEVSAQCLRHFRG